MPSTYSTSLGLELIGNGEQAGTWGTTTNNNFGTLLEQAITGVEPITLVGGDYTLTDYNGLPDQARNAVLVFGGLLAAPCNVIAPAVQKTYIVRNFSNATVTIKTASGNGVAIANAASEVIFCNGSDFFSATQFNYIDGDLTVSGSEFVGANVTVGKNIFGNASTDQWYVPVGNTAARTSSPINGLIRYNTDGKFYEGYANNAWVKFTVVNQGSYIASYAVVAGGGSGGSGITFGAGGGGGGGYLTGTGTFVPGTVYTVIVGSGGALAGPGSYGGSGSNSSVSGIGLPSLVAIGGGAGGPSGGGAAGRSGGSGGGSAPGAGAGGSGTAGQGYNGGTPNPAGTDYTAGGGGGAGAAGANGASGGAGGVGASTIITGATTYFAGGGGGGGTNGAGGAAGGLGGGGAAGAGGNNQGVNGTAYTGGGGGGCSCAGGSGQEQPNTAIGSNGGSGVVILSVPNDSYTGTVTGSPTISYSGSQTIMTFTASGTYTA